MSHYMLVIERGPKGLLTMDKDSMEAALKVARWAAIKPWCEGVRIIECGPDRDVTVWDSDKDR